MKKLTITVEDEVYAGLRAHVGPGRISRFVNDLVRPIVSEVTLSEGYRAMAADNLREGEAERWSDALIADAAARD